MTPARKVALSLAASALVAASAIFFIGVQQTLSALWQAGWPAFLAIGLTLYALMACQAAAWARLERQIGSPPPAPAPRTPPRFRTLLSSTIVAMAGNILMPSAHLGGEPAKILYAGRITGIPYTRLAGTVLLCKYIEAVSFVLFFALGAAATLIGFRHVLLSGPGRALGIALIFLTFIAMLLCLFVWRALARRWTPLTTVIATLAKLRLHPPFFKRLRHRSLRMELWAARVFREERRAVPAAFLWYLLTHFLLFLRPLAFFYLGWRIPLNPADLGLLFLAGQLMLAIQFMPSGIGTLDGGIVSVVALASMPLSLAQCAAFLLCIRFWDATVVLLGLALAARTGIGLFRKPSPALPVIAYPVPPIAPPDPPLRPPPDAPTRPG